MHSTAYNFPCCHYFCQKHIDICRTFELKRKLVFVVAKSLKGCLCGLFTSADGERRVKSNIGFVVPTKNCLASLSPKQISNVAGYDKSLIFPAQGVSTYYLDNKTKNIAKGTTDVRHWVLWLFITFSSKQKFQQALMSWSNLGLILFDIYF